MNSILKDKIKVDNTFINDLVTKSWEDSESIENQIAIIADTTPQAAKVVALLKDLLTSYYVFIGRLETLAHEPVNIVEPQQDENSIEDAPEELPTESIAHEILSTDLLNELDNNEFGEEIVSEPFEYFVDFDEPIGEPLTDKDLYS